MKIAFVAMSGGVDSSFVAILLKEQGYKVVGVNFLLHNSNEKNSYYLDRVKRVANYLDIDYKIIDLRDEFREYVYNYFVNSYSIGATPNPCIICNKNIKFGLAYKKSLELGAELFSTGHYVRSDGEYLYEAKDKGKDQSYFLFDINKSILKNSIFPLGDWLKSDVKKEIGKLEFFKDLAEAKESQEICFVDDSYVDILREHLVVDKIGDVLDINGNIIGKHSGYMHYTIGKRRGFKLIRASEPHYVVNINPKDNQITVGNHDSLAINKIIINNLNIYKHEKYFECDVKVRYKSVKVKCSVEVFKTYAIINLKDPIYGVANGQATVFYDGEKLIGGGFIIDCK